MTSQINRSQAHGLPQNKEDLFDGDPLQYRRFIRRFNSHTARGIVDKAVRLDLLISSCTGEARKNIEDCVMVSTPELYGYLEAKKILKTWYDQEHSIVNAYVRKLTEGPPLRPKDAGARSQLARDIKNCEMSCADMSNAGLDTQHTVASIFKRLPRYMQGNFRAIVSSQSDAGHPILLSQLSQFVQHRARLENSFLGQLVGQQTIRDSKQSPLRARPFRKAAVNTVQSHVNENKFTLPLPTHKVCAKSVH